MAEGFEPVPGFSNPPSERLDSWKEIAAYLKRDVRTVRRWEAAEGLPVHRHVHLKRGSVFAYRAELDVWWASRPAKAPPRHSLPRFGKHRTDRPF